MQSDSSAYPAAIQSCQTLLQLFFKKKSMEEIATILSLNSVAYAKKRKFLCKEQLIKFVKADRRYQSYL